MKSTNGCPKPNTDKTSHQPNPVELPAWLTRHRAKVAVLTSGAAVVEDFRDKAVDFIDIAPKPVEIKISLVEYFERIKRYKADRWQHDFCGRLQHAFEHRHEGPTRALVHAEAQLGKSSILAQCYTAWILGHDPMHRVALATYNVTRSQSHSKAVIGIMNLPIHKAIFPNEDGHVSPNASKEKWQTNIRRQQTTDAQDSFNPVGLQSGLTGSGFDTLIIDDPYADQKEAFSETVRANLQDFWEYTVISRLGEFANVFGMFHRYHVEDLAGYLLDKGDFEYWRYATVCDGPYVHPTTGQKFEDPVGRKEGEYISERRGDSYYRDKRKNKRVWMSMHQGRPSAEEGEFFNVGMIATIIDSAAIERRRQECGKVLVRAWDLAATEEGGDWSVAPKVGMSSDLRFTAFDTVRKQVDSAGRDKLMLATAKRDGRDVLISVPVDPGAAGKTAAYHIQQFLKGYQVVFRPTSGSKENRARPLASAVNSGMVEFATDEHLEDDDKWIRAVKSELRDFPLSEHDDCVDSLADGYNECFERVSKGLVIKNYTQMSNLVGWHNFAARFADNGHPLVKVPERWTTYVGVKITPDASTPNSAVLVARASQNTNLEDTLFVIAEYKEYTADLDVAFDWIDAALESYCESSEDVLIWLHPDSEQYKDTIWQKLQRAVAIFAGGPTAGLSELDWYLLPRKNPSPFNLDVPASGLYGIVADPQQLSVAVDEFGLYSMRQEFATWALNEKGEPNAIGAVADCLRMVCHGFRTVAGDLTRSEKIEKALGPAIRAETIEAIKDPAEKDRQLQRRMLEIGKVAKAVDKPTRGPMRKFGRR